MSSTVDGVSEWDSSNDITMDLPPEKPLVHSSNDPGLMFNNYTKNEVSGLHDAPPRPELNDPQPNSGRRRKKNKSGKHHSKKPSSASGSKRPRTKPPTDRKKPRKRQRAPRSKRTNNNNHNHRSQPNLMSVNDLFSRGFGKAPQGHMQAHRGHTPREQQLAASGPAGRLFNLTGRAPSGTLVDTLLDFEIPDVRARPKTVSPRTRRLRETRWKEMQGEHQLARDLRSRDGLASAGSQRRRSGSAGSDGASRRGSTQLNEDDPAIVALREKQAAETRAEQEMLAQQMGLSVEEMVALDAAASEGTEDAIQEYMEAFQRIDQDGSGSLSPDELRQVMGDLGEDMNEQELEDMIKEADRDGDGEIDYDEFTNMMRARKRRELLARNMTQAQAGHRKKRSSSMHRAQDEPPTSQLAQLDDGTGLTTMTTQLFDEFNTKYPNNAVPGLPPLQLSRATVAKRHMRDAPTAQFIDRYLTRPTPHVLKSGASANADVLRIQLTKAQDIIHQLDEKVAEGIEWVQQHCPVTNIKAQLYCQKWGLEKLTNLFNKIAYRQMIAALEKWSEFVDYQNNQDKAENYMKWKGSRRLVKMLEDFDTKQKAGGWDKWVHVIMHQRKREQNKSATDIERVARGFMGRRRVLNICTGRAAIEIQRVARGRLGRRRYQTVYEAHRRTWAASVIQRRYRGYQGQMLGRIIAKKKKEYDSACILQRAWRGFSGRKLCRVIAHKKLEINSAIYIQNMWRTRVSRQLVANMRNAIAEEESALYIQSWWRAVLGYREGQARLTAHRNQLKRYKGAVTIQNCWRCFVARKKADHKQLVRACLRVQNAWRCKQGRQSAHLLRAARAQIEREAREAQELADKLAKEMEAKRRIKEIKEQGDAACAIQGRFRQRMAKKTLKQKRQLAEEKRKNSEERALRTRMALRIQCSWRGKQGRLGAHLRDQARKFREEEESKAARAIQSRMRGRMTRKQIQDRQENARKDAEREMERARQLKKQQDQEELSASKMQALFRGKHGREKAEQKRAEKALAEKNKFDMEVLRQQEEAKLKEEERIKEINRKQMEMLKHQQKVQAQEEAEQKHAAMLIQQKIRAKNAENELEQRKQQHALELAAETDAVARQALRDRQEQEIAAVKLQQLWRSRNARKELANRKMKLAAEKRKLKMEQLKAKQELAALKIQGMARKWQAKRMVKRKLLDREDAIQKQKELEEEALEQEHAALILQKRMRGLHAKKEVAAKRAVVAAEQAALEEERQDLEDQAKGATALQSMFRARKAKQAVNDRRAIHEAEMKELRKKNAKEDELAALREKQEMELAAMKLQAIYRGRKLRIGFDDVRAERMVSINKRKRKLEGEMSAIKIQGMYRSWKARKILHGKMEAVKRRRQAFRNPSAKENWTQYWDDGSQCHYYFNKVTQETAWDEPAGGFTKGGAENATDFDEDAPNQEWADWVEKTDDASGQKYWYNKQTGVTEWADFVDEDGDGVDDRFDPIHNEDWDERTTADGQVYYYNKTTGVTQWKDFVDADGDGIDDRWDPMNDDDWEQRMGADGYTMMWYNLKTGEEYPVEEGGGGGGEFDWADWEEATDPSSGALYWINKKTGETQWE